MIAERFITQTRRAAARRRSLLTLAGGALMAAVPGPATASARKAGKNKNTKAKNRCNQQETQCVTTVTAYCATWSDPAACEGLFLSCCARFSGCSVESGLACLYASFSSV
jgi:hypothetical protein